MISSSRAWSSVGRRIAISRPSYTPAIRKQIWQTQPRRYESTIRQHTEKEAQVDAGPPSFTSHAPPADPLPEEPVNHTVTSPDSIPIPSMAPPPPPIPPRQTHTTEEAPSETIASTTSPGIAPSSSVPPTATPNPAGAQDVVKLDWKGILLEPIYTPLRAYGAVHKRRPLMTQFISALVIYFVGDMVAQGIGGDALAEPKTTTAGAGEGEKEEPVDERGSVERWAEDRDWWRTGRALIIGGVAAVPGFKWFVWLSESFNYRSKVASLCVKVLVNQATFTPIFNTYFFSMQSILTSLTPTATHTPCLPSPRELWDHISNTVPRSCYNSCKLWPAVTAFSFAFVRLEYRSLVAGVVAIGWQTYLSLLDSRVRRAERERQLLLASEPGLREGGPLSPNVELAQGGIATGAFGFSGVEGRGAKCTA